MPGQTLQSCTGNRILSQTLLRYRKARYVFDLARWKRGCYISGHVCHRASGICPYEYPLSFTMDGVTQNMVWKGAVYGLGCRATSRACRCICKLGFQTSRRTPFRCSCIMGAASCKAPATNLFSTSYSGGRRPADRTCLPENCKILCESETSQGFQACHHLICIALACQLPNPDEDPVISF